MTRPSRRSFLKALGAATAALALPHASLGDPAAGGPPPKTRSGHPTRFVFVYSPNGTIADAFFPTGTEKSFTLGPILAPLEPLRDKILVLAGVHNIVARDGPGAPHARGMGGLLTGRRLLEAPNTDAGYASGLSVDQALAARIGNDTLFRSIELAISPRGSGVRSRLSYAGPNEPVPPLVSPWDARDAIFGELGLDAATFAKRRARREKIIASAQRDVADLERGHVGPSALRLGYHRTSLDEVSRRLRIGQPKLVVPLPVLPDPVDVDLLANFPLVVGLQTDILVSALANDVTRVATLQLSHAASEQTFPALGFPETHHALSHVPDGDAEAKRKLILINRSYAQSFADLLARMAAVREGDGTLLDHSVVIWMSELGKGNVHSSDHLPVVIAGGANGALATGRFLDFGGASHTQLLVSMFHAAGLTDVTSFGEAGAATGPLPSLVSA